MKKIILNIGAFLALGIVTGGDSDLASADDGSESRYMVAAAHPDAAKAGLEMLRQGGSAFDAAIAVQAVLGLVEPQSSGIGGGAFAVYYDAATRQTVTFDGRETAPFRAMPDLFMDSDGNPMDFFEAVLSGRAVGTPGVLAMLEMAHSQYGTLPWNTLFKPAISLAQSGFVVADRLAQLVSGRSGERLKMFPESANYFFPDGEPLAAGSVKRNPAYADTLNEIANSGAQAFYDGQIAQDMVHAVSSLQGRSGLLTRVDLHEYRALRRPPICHRYRSYQVCGMGPPSSGALTVGQILGILENFDLQSLGPRNPASWHLIAEASKLGFADRNYYIADTDFLNVPLGGLLDSEYLRQRASLIARDSAINVPAPYGAAPDSELSGFSGDTHSGRSGTTHYSIVDAKGNALSLTSSIEGPFGSHQMVRGFMLNNQLTDFSFIPERDGNLVANRVEPGKRPRSSMSPTIVFDTDGNLRLIVGSPGGSRIIGYVAKTLVAVLDWGLPLQSAIDLPNLVNRNGATELERGTGTGKLQSQLESLGHQVSLRAMASGIYGIELIRGMLHGGADRRREGVAIGK